MSEPVKIIMYRTPAEAALWEGGMLWPVLSSAFWAFVITLVVLWGFSKFVKREYRGDYIAIGTLVIAFLGCLKFMYGVI